MSRARIGRASSVEGTRRKSSTCRSVGLIVLLVVVSIAEPQTPGEDRRSKLNAERVPVAQRGNAWFIRSDGGDREQCSGTTDAAYSGRGTKQACAFKHPYFLFTTDRYNDKAWVVKGGDTIIIRGGPYRVGYKGPTAKDYWGSCPGDPYNCSMPPIPSGTSENPTRLLGENYQNCQKRTQLFGGYALNVILNLRGAQHVDVECLELTDHAQCTRVGAGYPGVDGCRSSYPLSDYASIGIETDEGTSSIVLENLDIHGLTADGIRGPIGGEISVKNVRIAFNGAAGWDFDNGRGTGNAPGSTVRALNMTVEWNGCNEEYPVVDMLPAHTCFDQDHGGYGDGVGTPDTALDFDCQHCVFRYNTQDGLDLLHLRGGIASITNSRSYGNMGQQWKVGAMKKVTFQNNVTVNNCRRMSFEMPGTPLGFNKYLSLFCRAGGDGIALVIADDGCYLLRNNSFAGYGATSYDFTCKERCNSATITFQNNLHVGYHDPAGGALPGVFYMQGFARNPFKVRKNNIYFQMRTCPSTGSESCEDPVVVNRPVWVNEASLDGIDLHLAHSSPARLGAARSSVIGNSQEGKGEEVPEDTYIGAFP